MIVINAVVTTIPAAKLALSFEGISEILAGIAPYAERHFDRLDRMVGDSYILDYTLTSMGSLHGSNNENYCDWAERSKYVLPPKEAKGKIQIGGSESSEDEDVITIGESDSESNIEED